MKKYLLVILAIGLAVNACVSEATQTVVSISPTETMSPTSTSTVVSSLTYTPTVSTFTFTPAPVFPTITPTFDVSSSVTVTPAEKAVCPTAQPAKNLDFDFLNVTPGMDWDNRAYAEENMLNFLNTYGAEPLISHLRYSSYKREGKNFVFKDLTNDNVPELAIGLTSFFIFGCKNGRYEKIFEIPPDGYLQPSKIFSIKDNNRNGLLEMTLLVGVMSQGGHTYQIYEWGGEKFRNLLISEYPDYPDGGGIWVEATGKILYQNMDNDPLNELVLDSGIPVWSTYVDFLPWRNKRTVYDWNGQNFIPFHDEFAKPEFRFQAVQDGDLAFIQSEFDKALSLYQDAIFSDNLKDYSPEIQKNLQDNWRAQIGNVRPTPTPYPADPTEYPRLAAYAYYRIMLLHLVRGYETDAMTVFNTLEQKFPEGNPGHPYIEMANTFMKEYQSTHDIPASCVVAIQYATDNPEILVPLGSDYHGWQSHTYKPEDVCPFR
ncbi:MAG: hypothetical protein HY865_23830 [Chloroflexi bacterium]|nr:hypothetical protein [Chloroflexota bacterium]